MTARLVASSTLPHAGGVTCARNLTSLFVPEWPHRQNEDNRRLIRGLNEIVHKKCLARHVAKRKASIIINGNHHFYKNLGVQFLRYLQT